MAEPARSGRTEVDGTSIRLVVVPVLPSRAMTFGDVVLVRGRAPVSPRLLRHEVEHVRQYAALGTFGFLTRYIGEYLGIRRRLRLGHWPAYRRISYEIRAEWRARRALGIGVVTVAADDVRV